ncbi:hypothetical protein HII28_09795 [Planctomonas sp. JC2975]|uniref:hypothetical protein n=1 Tax=Planctomonas sp. JC2975 TaxID=2729626 RepID=UPI001473E335|nr:hypothetical protein [Planctomonas sp. JC2975]NNC12167.1 hypothetical protein [Planctomonas sp. JC2975]
MTPRGIRAVRGTAAASFAVFVAALFHDAAGGGLPSALAVVLSLAFAVPLCVALAGKRISLWRQTASVGVSQLLLHLLFGLGSGASGTMLVAPTGHVHAGAHVAIVSGQLMPEQVMHNDDAMMLVAHAAAAIATIVALRHGEKTLFALANFTVLLVTAVNRIATVAVETPTRMLVRAAPAPVAVSVPALGVLRHRGPPAALAA